MSHLPLTHYVSFRYCCPCTNGQCACVSFLARAQQWSALFQTGFYPPSPVLFSNISPCRAAQAGGLFSPECPWPLGVGCSPCTWLPAPHSLIGEWNSPCAEGTTVRLSLTLVSWSSEWVTLLDITHRDPINFNGFWDEQKKKFPLIVQIYIEACGFIYFFFIEKYGWGIKRVTEVWVCWDYFFFLFFFLFLNWGKINII